MKYRNIELKADSDSESELMCSVSFCNEDEDYDLVEEVVDELIDLFNDFKYEVEIDDVLENLIEVRCWDIEFNKNGVEILKKIYNKLIKHTFESIENPKIEIAVHLDNFLTDENGNTYNEDTVSLNEFLANIEY